MSEDFVLQWQSIVCCLAGIGRSIPTLYEIQYLQNDKTKRDM